MAADDPAVDILCSAFLASGCRDHEGQLALARETIARLDRQHVAAVRLAEQWHARVAATLPLHLPQGPFCVVCDGPNRDVERDGNNVLCEHFGRWCSACARERWPCRTYRALTAS